MALLVLGSGGLAHAQTVTVTVPTLAGFLENAMTAGVDSSIALDIRHNAGTARYQIDVRMPNTTAGYTALGGTGPSSAWTATTYTSNGYGYVRFTAACPGTGLAPNTTARFIVKLRPAAAGAQVDTRASNPFRVTASLYVQGNRCRAGTDITGSTPAPQPWVKMLGVADAGTALQQLAPPAVIRWTISNYSSAQKTAVTVTNKPAGTVCGPNLTLAAYSTGPGTGVLRCTYSAAPGGTFALGGTNVTGTSSPATAVGTTIAAIDVGDASVTWARSTLIRGRVRDPMVLAVNNASRATISRVEVIAPSSGWTVSSASASTAGGGVLSFAPGSSSDSTVVFTGAVAAGGTATLTIRYASLPGSGSATYPFVVKLTPSSGADYAVSFPQTVTVQSVASFPPEVSRLTVRSSAAGQVLEWTNPPTSHAGVVVLRATPPAVPEPPLDFVDYTTPANQTPELVFASSDPSVASANDPIVGAFNYLVCNRDASFIYSDCRTDVSGRVQYSGNSAVAPTGGWTGQVGGEALGQLQMFAAGRAAVPTNRGDISVINLVDGSRALDKNGQKIAPIPTSYGLPATFTPSWRLANGTLVAIAADQAGYVTAIDLEAGSEYWRRQKVGESFTAGVSGISVAGGSAAFKAAYPNMDVLFLGSSTTGNVLAINAATGETLWTVSTGSSVNALTTYDAGTNFLWVPTAAGVQAWELKDSRPDPAYPARLAWSAPLGPHSMYCVRTTIGTLMACADNNGTVRVLDKLTGAVKSQVETGATLPSTLVRVTTGTPGFTVGNADQLVRVVASDASLTSLTAPFRWAPSGWTLSPALSFSPSGFILVGASDLTSQGVHLYKRSSENLAAISSSPDTVQPANPRTLVGPPSYDSTNGLYFFGTEEGRIWAIPSDSF